MAATRNAFVAGVGAFLLTAVAALAQPPAPVYTPTSLKADSRVPRTTEGRPDFHGVWESPYLGGLTGIPFVTPSTLVITDAQSKTAHQMLVRTMASAPGIALDPEVVQLMTDTKGFPVVRGQRRSRLLVTPADGKMPFTPEALTEVNRATLAFMDPAGKSDNPDDRMPSERCLMLGGAAPLQNPNAFSPMQVVQTKSHVVLVYEGGDDTRIIPFSRTHGPAELAPPLGDSIAWWEGDTLVIETVWSPRGQRVRATPFGSLIVNYDAKVIERITRVGPDEMVYQFTVEDPKVFTGPWLGEFSLYRVNHTLSPGACHEANYGLANILSGARYEEKFPPVDWKTTLVEATTEPAVSWTRSATTANDIRSWSVIAPKNAAGEAKVGLRIERMAPVSVNGAHPSLSELNVFLIDCAGQRLRMESLATFERRNFQGEKAAGAPPAAWAPVAQRPAIAAAIAKACAA